MQPNAPQDYLPLSTERVTLRALEQSDVDTLRPFFQDMASLDYYLPTTARPLNRRQLEKLLDDWNDGQESFVFAVQSDHQLVGLINLDGVDWPNGHAEIGIALTLPEARGKGLAREAMQLMLQFAYLELGLHRLFARIIEDNAPSIRLFKSLDFRPEGVMKEHVYRHGHYRNMLIYGHLRTESVANP